MIVDVQPSGNDLEKREVALRPAGWQVYKFGGTSLGEPGRMAQALRLIEAANQKDLRLAVVVSALGDTTNWLIDAIQAAEMGESRVAFAILEQIQAMTHNVATSVLEGASAHRFQENLQEVMSAVGNIVTVIARNRSSARLQRDAVLATGEVLSSFLVASALKGRGIEAVAVDARDFLLAEVLPDGPKVNRDASNLKFAEILHGWANQVPIVTGFIARSVGGETVTLGRNGSDYSASLLTAMLGAKSMTVWTDVKGVMTADPDLVAEAIAVDRLSYDEALELAYFGTRMFHPRTMIPLRESGATLVIRSTLDTDNPGTKIDAEGNSDPKRPTCVTSLPNLALLGVLSQRAELGRPLAGRLLSAFETAGIKVWLWTESTLGQNFSVVVSEADQERVTLLIQNELGVELERRDFTLGVPSAPVTMITLVGQAMGRRPNVAGRFFSALGKSGVAVRAISQGASQRNISCIVDGPETVHAVRAVHDAFNLAHIEVSAFVLGKGTVGGSLLAQLGQQSKELRDHHDIHVRLVGLANSEGVLFDGEGLDPTLAAEELLGSNRLKPGNCLGRSNLVSLSRLPNPVLVDCTAATGMEFIYGEAFALGINVVSSNKKPLTEPQAEYKKLKAAARSHFRSYHFETTVGAALPVIETLKNLVRTGDRVTMIEGSFSGTLGFLCESVSKGEPLSMAVLRACDLGFAEPDPRDDLTGNDVARKALILARELGLEIDLADIELEPFIKLPVPVVGAEVGIFELLPSFDSAMEAHVRAVQKRGNTFRYMARIDPGKKKVTVGPVEVDHLHPAATLQGAEAFVAFYTERYRQHPLIVRGAGAGGEVTASGVLADILRLAQNVRGAP